MLSGTRDAKPVAALTCGVVGVVSAVVAYWLIIPGLVLGAAAIWLGWRARRRGQLELGSVAMTLGVVAVLLVPAVLSIAAAAEDWGRDCATDPDHDPNC